MKKGRRKGRKGHKGHKGHARVKRELRAGGSTGHAPEGALPASRGAVASPGRLPTATSSTPRQAPLVWRVIRAPFVFALNLVLALVLLFEEWGWKPLAAALAWFARFRLVARLEGVIAGLPPYASLAVFALPTTILFPVKIGALWLLANGHVLIAGGVLAAAKVVSTALVARIFTLTKPALMRIGWFARAYAWFVPWKEALFARVRASFAWRYGRMVKARVKQIARRALERWRPRLRALHQAIKERSAAVWRRYFGQSV